ncbi:transcription-repair coupling factor [Filifactor villosus]|uniref:Transcription-repair-coupling factor n=1 Tax=Filifactor villosus TaxID=29374 RepID=A0ABV9QIJ4_9FIRM
MEELHSISQHILSFHQIDEAVWKANFPISIYGFLPNQKLFHLAYLNRKRRQGLIYIMATGKEAQEAVSVLEKQGLRVVYFESEPILFYHIDARDNQKQANTLSSLNKVLEGDYDVAVFSCEELLRKYMEPQSFLNRKLSLQRGRSYDRDELVQALISIGYVREYRVEGIGQFALRGSILDIYSPSMEHPCRIEFFDDEVDSIREFDPISQKSIQNREEVDIVPALLHLYTQDMKLPVFKTKNEELLQEIEHLKVESYFEGLYKYADILYAKKASCLLDYFREDDLIILSDSNRVMERLENEAELFATDFKDALERDEALKQFGAMLFSKSFVEQLLQDKRLLLHSYLAKRLIYFKSKALIQAETRESLSFQGRINDFVDEVRYLLKEGYTVLILDDNENSYDNIRRKLLDSEVALESLGEHGKYCPDEPKVYMSRVFLEEGFLFTDSKLAFYTGNDIFRVIKRKRKKTEKKYEGTKIENFIELKPGDYVVHEAYGVGQFIEVKQKEFDGIRKDYIKIAYYGGDSLYVPLEQMDKVQSFVGSGAGDAYRLSKLGSSEWKKSKAKTKRELEEIAEDLVKLYAIRENEKGHAFDPDTPWQREFENEFPYEETEDQLKAIEEVKRDMEKDRVMDRLVCGDVGYGKTEVAIRAIFKACMESKQVVFLVPTTILAQQHYITLKNRFEHYPIKIGLVSRFRSKKEVEETFKGLAKGLIDVVVGTHKILSDKIKYKDLGLIVVDEEQRFGVKQKEAIKKLRTNIDCLTLSATPIPRTLHLSLSGIREMSVLNEPPQERRPIATYVTEAKSGIIADAIERELARGGQVFFVYNRVETIEKIHRLLSELVPDASIAVAHGQMTPAKLENIMIDFLNKEYDVLLSTTIVETGMDISNANTMIVYDADKMGLSQLYQLRGRVGRSSRQGYAYFMYEKDKVLTEIAEKRLKTIKEFTQFGAGFKVAMKDLEIRGAGSLLGEKQSGHIANIGYELYIRMLDEAIRKYKGEEVEEKIETELHFQTNAYIPNHYIEEEMEKIDIYKKIATIESREDYDELFDELIDRFADVPQAVINLMNIAYLRSIASKCHIIKIYERNKMVYFVGRENKIMAKKAFQGKTDDALIGDIVTFLEHFQQAPAM